MGSRISNCINEPISILQNKTLLFLSMVLPLSIIPVMKFGYAEFILAAIAAGLFLFSAIFNFRLVYSLFILSLFIPYFLFLHTSLYVSLSVILSFFICYTGFSLYDFRTPLNKAILIYLLSILPSLYNSINKLASIGMSYNLVAMLMVMFITYFAFRDLKKISYIINIYLLGVFANTIYVIILGVSTGNRVFGFSGVFYVDFVGLGSLLLAIMFIFSKGSNKLFIGILFLFFIAGLLITQTRNAWLSFGISAALLIVFLLFKGSDYFLDRKKILIYSTIALSAVMIIYFSISSVSKGLDERFSEKTQAAEISSEKLSFGSNSLVTRALIWHTAYNAFMKHPVFGIGLYSFPFSSQEYYTIPKELYKDIVERRTPHVTFIAVLTETGIVGMVGFLIMLYSIYKLVLKNLLYPQKPESVKLFLMINWTFIYIIISMFMTDAWLWGQQAMIMGIFMGFLLIQNHFNFGK